MIVPRSRVPIAAVASLAVVLTAGCAGSLPTSPETPSVKARPEAPLVEIRNARRPLHGILTGGQPTPEQIAQAAAAGYRTVVNTRSSREEGFEWEADAVAEAGMGYVFIETPGADGLTRENVEHLSTVLADPDAYPILIHCGSGNRVGALLALEAAWIDGMSDEDALQLGLDAGLTRLEATTRELLSRD